MLATLAIAALVGVTGVPAPAPSPLRHLVYTFTWGTSNSTEVHVSGLSNGSPVSAYTPNQVGNPTGISSFDASNSDKGSITVDVLREQPNDHGLVVTVSERSTRYPIGQCRDVRRIREHRRASAIQAPRSTTKS